MSDPDDVAFWEEQEAIKQATAVCDLCGSSDPLHSHSPEEWGFYERDERTDV